MARKKASKHTFRFAGIIVAAIVFGVISLKNSLTAQPCANSLSCEESLKLTVSNGEKAVFGGVKIDPPFIDLTAFPSKTNVLGTTDGSKKHIYVDLSTQTLRAMDGDTLFLETKISSGKWAPTPTGDFNIWSKFRAAKMSGGEGADYYYLPNVPYIMFFSNSKVSGSRGFSLHGTYWHNNFGHAMSHGCVNLRTIDAEKLFYWTNPDTTERNSASAKDGSGTLITIYGEAP